jgi:hypothetical protein
VVEQGDASAALALPQREARTVMGGAADRARLAREVLAFAEQLS